jgi:hypothetical protein
LTATTLATTTLTAIATASLGAATIALALGRCLGALLGDQLIEFAVFQHLGHGADREAKRGHGGAQLEGLLHGSGRPHFVVA